MISPSRKKLRTTVRSTWRSKVRGLPRPLSLAALALAGCLASPSAALLAADGFSYSARTTTANSGAVDAQFNNVSATSATKLRWKPYRSQQRDQAGADTSNSVNSVVEAAPVQAAPVERAPVQAAPVERQPVAATTVQRASAVEAEPSRLSQSRTGARALWAVDADRVQESPRGRFRSEIMRVSDQQRDAFADPFEDEPLRARGRYVAQQPEAPLPGAPNLSPPPSNIPPDMVPSNRYQPSTPPQRTVDPFESTTPNYAPQTRPTEPRYPDPRSTEPMPMPPMSDPITGDTNTAPSEMNCDSDKKSCQNDFAKLKANKLTNIELSIGVTGAEGTDFPCECTLGDEQFQPRAWSCLTYQWKAAGNCHKPLYFEDVQLERYGHSCKPLVQHVWSGVHFFGHILLLPYNMGLTPPDECVYALGYYRPGECAPYMIEALPITLRAALAEAGTIAGGILLIP